MSALLGIICLVAFVVYVLGGYPLLLGVLAAKRGKPVRRAPFEPTVSIEQAVFRIDPPNPNISNSAFFMWPSLLRT